MGELLHHWVSSVACAGGICAVCMYLCPSGRVKNVLQMACACVMVLALYAPLAKLDMGGYAEMLASYREQTVALTDQSVSTAERLNRMVIEQEYGEYILDKAQTCGVPLTQASVRVVWNEDGYWVPDEVVYVCAEGTVSESFQNTIETELGIPKERQSVHETNE